jgi:hypothetical protein
MKALIYALNFLIIVAIAFFQVNSDNDKTIIISALALVILVIINFISGVISQLGGKPIYKHYYLAAGLSMLLSLVVISL